MPSLAIYATHPIQYYAPLYRELARDPDLRFTVFYGRLPTPSEQGEGFGVPFAWDVDLRSGYASRADRTARADLRKELAAARWDALLLHGWHDPGERAMMAAAFRSGVPVLVRGDTHLRAPRPWWRRALRAIVLRRRLARCAACLAVGAWNAAFYRHFGVPDERIVSSPHCVDNAFFRAEAARLAPRRDALRAAWGASPEETVAAFVGKLIPEKCPADLVAALAIAARAGVRVRGVLAGDGPLRGELEARARASAAPAAFAGFLNQSRVTEVYAAADVVVLPSHSETWGLAVNEALACGKPCFVSDRVGCAPDLVIPGVTGAVFPHGDPKALAVLLEQLAAGALRFPSISSERDALLERHSCPTAARGIVNALRRFGRPPSAPTP